MKFKHVNSNINIPILGLGTWRLNGPTATRTITEALEIGYRHFDTADNYNNHQEIGQAIKQSKVNREEIFLVTKIWRTDLAKKEVQKTIPRFIDELQTDYLDLLLIHWPNRMIPIAETLNALEEFKKKKLIKSIGVSNFNIHYLQSVLATGIDIVNNQIELHPTFNQKDLVKFCHEHQISVTAYSPLGQGIDLNLRLIKKLANKYQNTPAQIILNWIISKDIIAIPRASSKNHLLENWQAIQYKMAKADYESIDHILQVPRLIKPSFHEFDY